MMSGRFNWNNGTLYGSGTYGGFWTSTPNSYIYSRYLSFSSADVYPKNYVNKPYGFPLRCVARFFRTSTYAQKIIVPLLPELPAAFLFRL